MPHCYQVGMKIEVPLVVSTNTTGGRGFLQLVKGGSRGSLLSLWSLLMEVWVEPQCFSCCLIRVSGFFYHLKMFSVLLSCPVPCPLARESWLFHRAFFVHAHRCCFQVGGFSLAIRLIAREKPREFTPMSSLGFQDL